ncbi:hypothetical protein ACFT1A_26725 [Rhodococcus sp. NPDC057135]|uniref:hypothetical protein n=1 Tax=Rhodococcus sp. NPDC057135 TaxID=3346028 RepID=UPI003639492F
MPESVGGEFDDADDRESIEPDQSPDYPNLERQGAIGEASPQLLGMVFLIPKFLWEGIFGTTISISVTRPRAPIQEMKVNKAWTLAGLLSR